MDLLSGVITVTWTTGTGVVFNPTIYLSNTQIVLTGKASAPSTGAVRVVCPTRLSLCVCTHGPT